MDKHKILTEAHDSLQAAYGDRLRGVVLYGSLARGDESDDSDIDLLVILDEVEQFGVELRRIIEALTELTYESGRSISGIPCTLADYDDGDYPLYKNAKREGIRV